jgi:hypothetical protein
MRTRVKNVQGLEMPRDFQWSGFSSFLGMRTRAKHVQGPEMPRDFQWSSWFQLFSRHADTCQARTWPAARFCTVLFPTIPISMRKLSSTFTNRQWRTIFFCQVPSSYALFPLIVTKGRSFKWTFHVLYCTRIE